MECPKCDGSLSITTHKKIEVDQCDKCRGMWLDLDELDSLEDVKHADDELKGTTVFSTRDTDHKCPHCEKNLKSFNYRLYDLELELCDDHGYWLDNNEEKRVLELMKGTKKNLNRSMSATEEWDKMLKMLKSKSFFSKIKSMLQ